MSGADKVALEIARELAEAGVPILVVPGIPGQPGEFNWEGVRWRNAEADPAVVDAWQPGDALIACMGHVCDGLDFDQHKPQAAQSKADMQAAGAWPRSHGRARTPSGGTHDLIAPLHAGSRDGVRAGIDVKGGCPDGKGRGVLFIAPTVRLSKATGELAPYVWEIAPDLSDIEDVDDATEVLADVVRAQLAKDKTETKADDQGAPGPVYTALSAPMRASVDAYVAAAVRGISGKLHEMADWPQGQADEEGHGWERRCANAAFELGALARADWTALTSAEAHAAYLAAAPTDTDWTRGDVEAKWRSQWRRANPRPWPTRLSDPTPPEPEHQDESADEPPLRTSWARQDLSDILDGSYEPLMPTVGRRQDGPGLFYPGLIHSVAGETEAGKSWFALDAVAHELRNGRAAIYLDFEDTRQGVTSRLMALSVPPAVIGALFCYIGPTEPVTDIGCGSDLAQALGDLSPTLVILDGVTEAMSMHGMEMTDNTDVAKFGKLLPRKLAAHGPAVVSLDHVVKNREARGRYAIGGVHKMNGLNGAAYTLENRHPFAIGRKGRSGVYVAKDRPGQVRRHTVPSAQGDWFGDLVLDSHDVTFVESVIYPAVEDTNHDRPVALMVAISEVLLVADHPMSGREIADRVKGKAEDKRMALASLVDLGYVTTAAGARNSILHTLVSPFLGDSL